MTSPEEILPKRRKKPRALTPMSVKLLESRGFIVAKVEQRLPIPGKFVTLDAFNVFDLLVACPGFGIAGVQVTGGSGGNAAARRAKVLAEPRARVWIESGGRILLHAWRTTNDRVRGAKKTLKLLESEIVLSDFPTDSAPSPSAASPAAS